jgi:uracil phosphoribosyltransferase
MNEVNVVEHPLVQHKLTLLRDKERSTKGFRQLMREIATLLCYEVTRDLSLDTTTIETPLESMQAPLLSGKKLVFAPILRAGVGLLDGMLDLVPSARVAHIGLYRDPDSLNSVQYFFKAPLELANRVVIAIDPMLATGNSAVAALDRLAEHGATDLRFVCVLATPAGIANVHARHPGVRIWTAAIDGRLDEHGYIRPGLGDAGDRLYGTR